WSKLFYRKELLTLCCDKYQVRTYVENKVGSEYLIPMVGYFKDFNEINLNEIPNQCVMKGTHGSGMNHLVFDSTTMNWDIVRDDFRRWLKFNQFYHSREWQYKNVPPGIIVEEMLLDESGKVPSDIKIHCFRQCDGSLTQIIQLDVDRFGSHKQNYYDEQWNLLDLSFSNNNFNVKGGEKGVAPPDNLEELLSLSRKLSEDFPYVRVDLFTINNKVFFGELTFHHQSGLTKPSGDWDNKLG
ncbi:ATP-grasp fold amidoligase family protein, partial [Photobacterium sanctipauli]